MTDTQTAEKPAAKTAERRQKITKAAADVAAKRIAEGDFSDLDIAALNKLVLEAEGSFIQAGRALGEIQGRGKWEERGEKSFENYIREQFDHTRQWAYEKMTASFIAVKVAKLCYGVQLNEWQALSLRGLEEEDDILTGVVESVRDETGGKITASALKAKRKAMVDAPGEPNADETAVSSDAAPSRAEKDLWGAAYRALAAAVGSSELPTGRAQSKMLKVAKQTVELLAPGKE